GQGVLMYRSGGDSTGSQGIMRCSGKGRGSLRSRRMAYDKHTLRLTIAGLMPRKYVQFYERAGMMADHSSIASQGGSGMPIVVHSPFSGRPVKIRDEDVGRAVRDEENRIFYVLERSDGSGHYGAPTRSGNPRDEQRYDELVAKMKQ